MEHFTPLSGFIGGCLIGFAALVFLHFNKQICGISGMVGGLLPPYMAPVMWRVAFLVGLLFGGFLLSSYYSLAFEFKLDSSWTKVILAGFLVGFGSRFGKGCTSGHGVCGIGRLAPRSIFATVIFLLFGILTASVIHLFREGL